MRRLFVLHCERFSFLGHAVTLALTGWLLTTSAARAADTVIPAPVEVSGTVQVWTRTCRSVEACDLPVAVGQAHPVRTVLAAPASRPGLSQASSEVLEGPWRVQMGFFMRWVGTDVSTGDYVTFQIRVSRSTDQSYEFITECSFYDRVPTGAWLATGSCSGAVPGSMERVGVTFQKSR